MVFSWIFLRNRRRVCAPTPCNGSRDRSKRNIDTGARHAHLALLLPVQAQHLHLAGNELVARAISRSNSSDGMKAGTQPNFCLALTNSGRFNAASTAFSRRPAISELK